MQLIVVRFVFVCVCLLAPHVFLLLISLNSVVLFSRSCLVVAELLKGLLRRLRRPYGGHSDLVLAGRPTDSAPRGLL